MVQFLKVPVNLKINNSSHELFIFKILLIAIDWNFLELHHYLILGKG